MSGMGSENRTLKLIKTIVGRSYQRMTIDPADIGYLQYPEFRSSHQLFIRPRTRRLAGNWDQEIDADVFWSSVYEPAREAARGMVPLHRYVFYRSLEAHFLDNEPWQDTRWYRWLVARQDNAPVRRYRNKDEMAERLEFLEKLYSDFKSGQYRDEAVSRPIINIGRQGRMAIEDGRHRLCMARVAGLKRLSVDVNIIHADTQQVLFDE